MQLALDTVSQVWFLVLISNPKLKLWSEKSGNRKHEAEADTTERMLEWTRVGA